jgi:hypothetical protein
VPDHRLGHDECPSTCNARAPAEIDVLAEHRDLIVESTERVEEVGTDEDAASRYGEGLLNLVVLGLVELEALDSLYRRTESIDAEAELQDSLDVIWINQLRADYPCVAAKCLLHHLADRVSGEHHVVVTEDEVARPVDHTAHGIRTGAEPHIGLETAQVEVGGNRSNTVRERRFTRLIDDEHGQSGVVLSVE